MRMVERAASIAYRGIALAVSESAIPEERHKGAAIYLLVTGCNVPMAVAGRVVGCSKQNVSKGMRKTEDRRDEAKYESELARLEDELFGGL